MPAIINTNMQSLNAQRNLTSSQGALSTSLQRLSSGLRVNSAKDDAAGLAIATRMTAQSRGMSVAIRNANDGISMAQTAEGALAQIKDHLLRMRDLAVQSANGTNTSADRGELQQEFLTLQNEIVRIHSGTQFNQINVLATTGDMTFQVGAGTTSATDQVAITSSDISATDVSGATDSGTSITGASEAVSAMSAIDAAIVTINAERSKFGAAQSRFEGIVSVLQIARENQTAAASRIMDTDFASETAELTRTQILQQAGTAMLAQANSMPQNVLSLLQG